jgi:hypothetical protein
MYKLSLAQVYFGSARERRPGPLVGRSALARRLRSSCEGSHLTSSATNNVYACTHYMLFVFVIEEPDRIWLARMHIATYAPKRPIEPVIGSILLLAFWADT